MSPHDELQVRLSVAAQFPVHFFLENIAVRHDNSMLITVVTPKELYFLPPPRTDAEVEPVLLHTFDELATGIAELEPDLFVVISTNAYTTHENYLHRVDLRGHAGQAGKDPGIPEGGAGAEWLLRVIADDNVGRRLARRRDLADRL